ncbi:hypothetical protein PIROE2DRAFT_10167 [Piromyces sp. E2]|nr:hypothetical protein PIROE2DRAFT_10167 [Piromyces sp. E2]|eukprot:OUM63326.1 hypothetical protein PIROE2DRAFT_10167 [Piromyces sp. E2]
MYLILHCEYFRKYYRKYRFLIYLFIIIYTASYTFVSLYEPLLGKYSKEYIADKENCSSGYRSKLYQYVLNSPVFNIPFSITAFIFSNEISKGIKVSRGEFKEKEKIGVIYFLTACSGILICIFTNSFNQVKRKFGGVVKNDESVNSEDVEYLI